MIFPQLYKKWKILIAFRRNIFKKHYARFLSNEVKYFLKTNGLNLNEIKNIVYY